MTRSLTVAAAQMGPIALEESRTSTVARMLEMMREAQCDTLEDEVITHECDLDRCRELKDNVFNFARHRRPEAYQLICDSISRVS